MLAEVTEAVEAREHVLLSSGELLHWETHTMPTLPRVYKGRRHWTVPTTLPAPRIMDEADGPYFPTELAGEWLRLIFHEQKAAKGVAAKRVPWRKGALPFLAWQVPAYFAGGRQVGDLAYVDLDRSFFNLYRTLALDLHYVPDGPDTTVGIGRFRFIGHDEMATIDKLALQAVSGMFRRTYSWQFTFGHRVGGENPLANTRLAPDLWGVLSDTLMAIAHDAIDDFGAVYFHTDGAILPAENSQRFIDHLESAWRLPGRVKSSGTGVVTALGRWRVGEWQSVLGPGLPTPGHTNLRPMADGRRLALQRLREWTA